MGSPDSNRIGATWKSAMSNHLFDLDVREKICPVMSCSRVLARFLGMCGFSVATPPSRRSPLEDTVIPAQTSKVKDQAFRFRTLCACCYSLLKTRRCHGSWTADGFIVGCSAVSGLTS